MPKDSYIGRWAKRGKKQSISEEEMNSILQRYFHEGILLREFLYTPLYNFLKEMPHETL